MCCCTEGCCIHAVVLAAGHAAVGRAAVAGQYHPIGAGAPGLDGAALSDEDGPCRALADGAHGFQTEPARYSHDCHSGTNAVTGVTLGLTQRFVPALVLLIGRGGRVCQAGYTVRLSCFLNTSKQLGVESPHSCNISLSTQGR